MTSKNKYRSGLEERVGEVLEVAGFDYEPFKVPYTVQHQYIPDFVYDAGPYHQLLVEVKGYFRPGDTQKYKAIRDSLVEGQELVFMLQSPHKKVRKGAKLTMAQWCEKERLQWFDSAEGIIEYVNK